MQLVPCPSCARHVKSSESACPFCSASLSGQTISRAPVVRKRLERLAMFTFAATLAVTGCAAVGGDDDDKQEQDLGGVHPMYGMPPVAVDAGHADSGHPATDAGPPCTPVTDDNNDIDNGGFAAMYGMPPVHPTHPCPVEPTDAGPAHEDAGGFHPMYGMPPAHQ
jgi:hypothetical protein